MTKRGILPAILAVLLCWGAVFTPASGAAAEPAADTGSHEIMMLKALGIIKNYGKDGYVPSYAITRGEVAVMILNMLGMDPGVKIGEEQTEEWAAPAMEKVAQMGIMTDPSAEPILYQDLVTVLVRASGYELAAQDNGGYPAGYLKMGSRAGITTGVSGTPDGQVSKAMAARMFCQTATADMVVQTGFGTESTFEVVPGKTILSEYRKIYEVTGRLTGTEAATLSSETGTELGTVSIDNLTYETGNTNPDGLLGYEIQAFYQLDSSETRTLLYLQPRPGWNRVTTVEAEDLQSFSGNTYTYRTETGAERTVSISPKADVIYNNKPVLAPEESLFLPEEGKVALISVASGPVDLVVITAYQTLVVQYYSQESKTLYDKYAGQPVVMDPDDPETVVSLRDVTGKAVQPGSLKPMDVVTVVQSADGRYVQGTVSRAAAGGMLSYVRLQEKDSVVKIDGTEYELCRSFELHGEMTMKAGTNVKLYLDASGRVAAAELQSSSLQVGYLTMAALDTSFESTLKLRIFTSGGDFAELECAGRVKLDGETVSQVQGLRQRLQDANAGQEAQLIQYRTNADGQVAEIDTQRFDEKLESLDSLRLSTPLSSLAYKNNTKIFGNKLAVDGDTIIMNVPKDGDRHDDALYEIKSLGYFANDSSYVIEGYTTRDTFGAVQVVVMYDQSSGSTLDKTSAIAVVESVGRVYDPETGETLDQIVCYGNDGGTLSVEDGIDLSQIRGGDVIRFSKGQGQIKKLEKIYDYESGAKTGAADPGGTSTVLGYVYYKDAPYIRVSTVNPAEETVTEDNLLLYKADAFTAYLYDGTLKEPEVVTTNVGEMLDYYHAGEDCAKVLIATRNNDPTTLIVIR